MPEKLMTDKTKKIINSSLIFLWLYSSFSLSQASIFKIWINEQKEMIILSWAPQYIRPALSIISVKKQLYEGLYSPHLYYVAGHVQPPPQKVSLSLIYIFMRVPSHDQYFRYLPYRWWCNASAVVTVWIAILMTDRKIWYRDVKICLMIMWGA